MLFGPGKGETYEGRFLKGCFDGMGRHTLADGSVYHGVHEGGVREGEGTEKKPDGEVYNGRFSGDHRHGKVAHISSRIVRLDCTRRANASMRMVSSISGSGERVGDMDRAARCE